MRVWEVATGRCLHTLKGHTKPIVWVGLTSGGRLAISASEDATIRIWDLARGECLHVAATRMLSVSSFALSADGQVGIVSSDDDEFSIWRFIWDLTFE
jgi:WD40 repeat protein